MQRYNKITKRIYRLDQFFLNILAHSHRPVVGITFEHAEIELNFEKSKIIKVSRKLPVLIQSTRRRKLRSDVHIIIVLWFNISWSVTPALSLSVPHASPAVPKPQSISSTTFTWRQASLYTSSSKRSGMRKMSERLFVFTVYLGMNVVN